LGGFLTYYNFFSGNKQNIENEEYSVKNTYEDIFNEKVYNEDK
jgi:hypothetical protein